jgi:hypothetical protein
VIINTENIHKYKVEITPLAKNNVYGDVIDVTEFVKQAGIGDISIRVDSTDFDVGVYTYDKVDISFINFNGWFSDINMGSTRFKFTRDRAKLNIFYRDETRTYIEVFKGIINDEFTQQDFDSNIVKFRALSYDSIFRKLNCNVDTIAAGQTIKTALVNLLNRPAITNLINFDLAKINPVLNLTIDDVEALTNVSFKVALDSLLQASCSVLFIDDTNTVVIKSRDHTAGVQQSFYNWGDVLGRNNIIGISKYNTGTQRAFNLFKIGDDISALNVASINKNGLREKSLDAVEKIITNVANRQLVVDTYLSTFSNPKIELELMVKSELAKDLKLFDLVTVDYRQKVVKRDRQEIIYNGYLPLNTPYNLPIPVEGQKIRGDMGFKIIEKRISVDDFTTTLKLREIGTNGGDSII